MLTGFARDFAGGGLLNSFRWGLDNRIHVATSFAGGNVRRGDRPGDKPVSVRGRGLIWDPRDRSFEATSGGGQHGMGMDDWGRKFLCSNVNPIQLLTRDGRYAARNPFFAPPPAAANVHAENRLMKLHRISPLESWRVERSRGVAAAGNKNDEGSSPGGLFTSASGITIYRGDAWPREYRGDLFVGEVANNLVYRAKLATNGVGVAARRADQGAEFLASTDPWFRPVQFANGPDGNLYVVDMYRELIEGSAFVPERVFKNLDPSNGTNRGRVYRIVSTNNSDQRHADNRNDNRNDDAKRLPGRANTSELVAMLEHPNGWTR
ncbi:MAG: PQQ-dependent sugar dehydrogenase, partial [Planctomycetales bacterium]